MRSGSAVRVVAMWPTLCGGLQRFVRGTFRFPADFQFPKSRFLNHLASLLFLYFSSLSRHCCSTFSFRGTISLLFLFSFISAFPFWFKDSDIASNQ